MSLAPTAGNRTVRSSESHAFEAFWHSLRGQHLVPRRSDFHPGKAKRFISDLVLVEALNRHGTPLRIRVTGGRFDDLIGSDLTGCNPTDFLPRAYRAGATESARLVFEAPCGLWQISPAHLVRGWATHLEITMLPLAPDRDGPAFLLCHVRSLGDLMRATLPTPNGLGLDTAATFQFLDVGAGVPAWTAQAA
jgi:hypothetical protein